MEERGGEFQLVSVAVDVQGAAAPRRYAESTLGTFPTLVDSENLFGETFGFKAVPNGVLIGADGRLDGLVAGGFEIRRDETRELVERWLDSEAALPQLEDEHEWSPEALRLFREAGAALRRGEPDAALALLKQAFPLEPDNLIIRKQMWALEHPEHFYEGKVDYGWQREQLAAGR